MSYRDDLYQAHRRIQQLEQELHEERAKTRQLVELVSGARRDHAVYPRWAPAERRLPLWEWWPALVACAGIVGYLMAFGAVPPESPWASSMPYDWAILSAVAGAAIYSLDVLVRWRNGGARSMIDRLILVVAVIVSLPALALAVFGFGPVLGFLTAVGVVVGALVSLVRWIIWGTAD